MENLLPGDHLVVDISNNTSEQFTRYAGARHHGLYIGDGEVIHFNAHLDAISLDTLAGFSGGCTITVKRNASNACHAIKIAKSKLGKGGYNLLTNNCEHFVNHCLDERHTSEQVADNYHVSVHAAARFGLLGAGATHLAKGPIGLVAIGSTVAKGVGESIGLPDRVNTVIGTPGDLVSKPIESCITGVVTTLTKSADKINEGDITGAAGELIKGTVETTIDTVVIAPVHVVLKCWSAIRGW